MKKMPYVSPEIKITEISVSDVVATSEFILPPDYLNVY